MEVFWLIVAIVYIDLMLLIFAGNDDGQLFFNPKENYEYWDSLNWFGVWFLTILYWIVFLPFTIIAGICWLFTVGRK